MPLFKGDRAHLKDILEIGRPLQVITSSAKKKLVYRSSVADFDNDNIFITPLSRQGLPAELKLGERIQIIYFGSDAMYKFSSSVIGHKKENVVVFTVIELPHKYTRTQRREFYRLPLKGDVIIRKVAVENRHGEDVFIPQEKKYAGVMEDISGGGMAFKTQERFEESSCVEVEFCLAHAGEEQWLKEIVRIIRVKKVKPLDEKKGVFEYTYGGNFASVSDETQTQIVRFIMRMQIEYNKRGKL